jgi:hypothetical protein
MEESFIIGAEKVQKYGALPLEKPNEYLVEIDADPSESPDDRKNERKSK